MVLLKYSLACIVLICTLQGDAFSISDYKGGNMLHFRPTCLSAKSNIVGGFVVNNNGTYKAALQYNGTINELRIAEDTASAVTRISANGKIAVGNYRHASGVTRPFFVQEGGIPIPFTVDEGIDYFITAVSATGMAVAGYAITQEGERPFTGYNGSITIHNNFTHDRAYIKYISDDGTTAIGTLTNASIDAPFIFDLNTQAVDILNCATIKHWGAFSISQNGRHLAAIASRTSEETIIALRDIHSGTITRTSKIPYFSEILEVSHDGKKVAMRTMMPDGPFRLIIYNFNKDSFQIVEELPLSSLVSFHWDLETAAIIHQTNKWTINTRQFGKLR